MRPKLNKHISEKDFRDFYWLKSELRQFCKANGISAVGSKEAIANRIAMYLRTGKKEKPTLRFRSLRRAPVFVKTTTGTVLVK